MQLDTPDSRQTGDYDVRVRPLYGAAEASISLGENDGLVLRRVTAADCDRAIRAFAAAKREILAALDKMAVPHGRSHLYHGTCQLCGKPDADELHAEPEPLVISDSTIEQARAFAQPGNTMDDILKAAS